MITARSVEQVISAVAAARRTGRALRLTTTGHAMDRTRPSTDSLLLRTLIDAPISVDPGIRTARVPAGKTWGDVLPAVTRHGLTALHASSGTVGVIGYLLGGGLSFYGRRFGLAANSVRSLTVVLADGEVVEASATQRSDLFWALRGGDGGFGVVVEAEIELVPLRRVVTGTAIWDRADAARLAPAWQEWARTAPPEITTSFRLLRLAGRRVVAVDGAVAADDRRIANDLLRALGRPLANTWAPSPPERLHRDRPHPTAARSDSALIHEIDERDWAEILDTGPDLLELRQLGGAFAVGAATGGALDHFTAPTLYYGVGPGRELAAVRAALRPYLTGYTAPNFVEHYAQPQRTHDVETRIRIERVRLTVDPTGVFSGDVAVITRWASTG